MSRGLYAHGACRSSAPASRICDRWKLKAAALIQLGTAGKRMCPMITPRQAYRAVLAAGVALALLPAAADARGGGHGGIGAHMGTATFHPLAAAAPAMHAASPQPSKMQTGAPPNAASLLAGSAITSGPPPAAVPDAPLPASAIGAPAPQATAIAPLSPPPATVILGGGGPVLPGAAAPSTASSSTPTSASPSESAPSAPGGGGDTLEACMGFWDSGTHMTKTEWRAACTRTLNRIDLVTPVPGTPPTPRPALHHAKATLHR
jgi:hypothetical protein